MSEVKGLDKLLKKLNNLDKSLISKMDAVVEANAREIELKAKTLAPVDLGKLRQGIKSVKVSDMKWRVYANATGLAPYSAYMEFGTGGLVSVPNELREIAIQFKGRGIKKIDLRPQPYLYPAYVQQKPTFYEDLIDLVKKEISKI